MNTLGNIEFHVDQQYENEKGIFTVISIQNDEMIIRWTDGEEIRTEIKLQQRIQTRRRRERMDKDKKATMARISAVSQSRGNPNALWRGLKFDDFKDTAAQTTWRGRKQLGGAVTEKMPQSSFNFNSWAFGQKPEVHWSDIKHRGEGDAAQQARFFVRLNHLSLIFGFGVARPDIDGGTSRDWNAFSYWLARPENDDVIRGLSLKNSIVVYDRAPFHISELTPVNGGWSVNASKEQKSVESIATYFESVHAAGGLDLEVAVKLDKEDAVKRGEEIAGDIAGLFNTLMPLYRVAIV